MGNKEPVAESNKTHLREILLLLTSWSWWLSTPMRLPKIVRGYKDPGIRDVLDMTESELIQRLSRLRRSSSWRATAFLRRGKT